MATLNLREVSLLLLWKLTRLLQYQITLKSQTRLSFNHDDRLTCHPRMLDVSKVWLFSSAAAHWKSQHQSANNATPKPAQTYAVLSAIQQSPSNQPSPLGAQNQSKNANATPAGRGTSHRPKERMHHNIPHRYDDLLMGR